MADVCNTREAVVGTKTGGAHRCDRRVSPSSSSTGTSWTNCSHQRRDDCLAVHSWMSNLQRRPARYMTATAMISGSHCRDSMVHRLPGTATGHYSPGWSLQANQISQKNPKTRDLNGLPVIDKSPCHLQDLANFVLLA